MHPNIMFKIIYINTIFISFIIKYLSLNEGTQFPSQLFWKKNSEYSQKE